MCSGTLLSISEELLSYVKRQYSGSGNAIVEISSQQHWNCPCIMLRCCLGGDVLFSCYPRGSFVWALQCPSLHFHPTPPVPAPSPCAAGATGLTQQTATCAVTSWGCFSALPHHTVWKNDSQGKEGEGRSWLSNDPGMGSWRQWPLVARSRKALCSTHGHIRLWDVVPLTWENLQQVMW